MLKLNKGIEKVLAAIIAIMLLANTNNFCIYAEDIKNDTQKAVFTTEEEDTQETAVGITDDQVINADEEMLPAMNSGSLEDSLDNEDPLSGRANGFIDEDFLDNEGDESQIDLYSYSAPSIVHNEKFNNCVKRTGIDVSSFQGNIDWNQVKASGIEFAFIRIGYRTYETGTLGADSKGISNLQGALNAGIKVGVYMFSQATTIAEAQEEADYITNKISGYNISLPVVIDYEYVSSRNGLTGRLYNANLSKADATAIVNAFCERVQNKGYIGMLYANKNMLNEHLNVSDISSKYKVWLANYTTQSNYGGDYSFWQYTSTGSVSGVSGSVDMDVWYDNGTISNGAYSVCDGIYTLSSKLNSTLVLDVAAGSGQNGANIQLYQENGTNAQKFRIQYLGSGYYTLTNLNSQKVIDVAAGSGKDGANIQQYTYNNSFAQKWVIKSTGDGYYKIVSSINGKCLDVSAGKAVNGANIQLYADNNSDAQKFKLTLKDAGQSIQNGVYQITSALDPQKGIDIAGGSNGNCANVQLYQLNGSDAQKWIVTYIGDGYYAISAFNSGKALDIYGGNYSIGSNVQIYQENNSIAQKWIIREVGNGNYYIIAANSGNYLDIKNGHSSNGTNIQVYSPNGSYAQQFRFVSAGNATISQGEYYIESTLNYNFVLDVAGASKSAGGNIQLYWKNNSAAQKFEIISAGNGNYIIKNMASGMVLDVCGGSRVNYTNVQQYYDNNSNAQKWTIVSSNDGTVTFVNVASGKCLDVTGGLAQNGNNVSQFASNRTNSQRYRIVK